MKKIFTLVALVGMVMPAIAQVDINAKADTTKMRMGNKKVWIFRDKTKPVVKLPSSLVWTGVDVGINGWATPGGKAQIEGDYSFMELDYGRSWVVSWNVFEAKVPLNKAKTVTFWSGAGFEWNNYSFKQKISLREANDYGPVGTDDFRFVDASDPAITYKRTRLQTSWFNVPLMLNFRTVRTEQRKNQFNFSIGAVGGVRMGANQREIFLDEGSRTRNIRRDDFMLQRFRATAMVRMKYSHWLSVFGSYTFTPMFKEGAPLVYPWSVGISINPY